MTNTPEEDSERLLYKYDEDNFTRYQKSNEAYRFRWNQTIPWFLAGLFGFMTGVLCLREISHDHLPGLSTDLSSARPLIQLEKRQMKGDDDHLFVGTPSLEIDNAWRDLLNGLNVNLDATEIGEFADDTFSWPQDGKFFAGLQVYHSLHCLNRLRQCLYLPYYNRTGVLPESYTMGHADHCISFLRHSIQCHADLTPMLWSEKSLEQDDGTHATSALHLNMDTMHTCRKWEPIHQWASSRQFNYRERDDLVEGGGHMRIFD
ncbi:hypothetical protein PENPOL_c001G00031 [Penicillium polonicum]|uniref:Tat pathway signal sequence n=1 Tax=Penicillium polonicum TaxID=60169 RepID=A0A1V6P3L8_PENPO|nr:hypothetical protein PENPOL_c001G00031 [Penicillium polonicum]